jgi:hypothetical protein
MLCVVELMSKTVVIRKRVVEIVRFLWNAYGVDNVVKVIVTRSEEVPATEHGRHHVQSDFLGCCKCPRHDCENCIRTHRAPVPVIRAHGLDKRLKARIALLPLSMSVSP